MALISNGTALGSQYIVCELIGRGGMGLVYRGENRESGEEVAIKFLRQDLAADSNVVARFVQERSILLSVTSPHLVTIRDLIVEGDNLAIVMDLVSGRDLRHLITTQGTLAPAEALRLAAQVLRGLAVVHRAGIVHRDVKPENILLDTTANPALARITDFGVSRMATGANLTRLTSVIGTPEYMAPELYESEKATPAADIYAVGVLLYEMLTGRTPYAGGTPIAVMRRQLEFDPPEVDGMNHQLWQALLMLLDKSPARTQDADGVAEHLDALSALLADAPALPVQERPSAEQWIPTPSTGSSRISNFDARGTNATAISGAARTTNLDADGTRIANRTVVASRRATLAEPIEGADSASVDEPGSDSPDEAAETQTRRRRPAFLFIGIPLALLLIAGIGFFLKGRGASPAGTTSTYAFAPVTRADGLVVARQWNIGGKDGRVLTQTLTLTNSRKSLLKSSFDDVIPKDIARDVTDITFTPSPAAVVKKDPVVRYRFALKPGASLQVTATCTVAGTSWSPQRLSQIASVQQKEERSYLATKQGGATGALISLASIRVARPSLRLKVGAIADASLSARLSNGRPAPAVVLKELAWSSSNPKIADVLGGRIVAKSPGRATITAQAGTKTASIAVTVVNRPKSEAVGEAPSAPRQVTARASDGSVAISWLAPSSSGGASVDGYLVTAHPGNGYCETTKALTCTISGLANGTAYTFSVRAGNSAGLGKPGKSAKTTPSGPPSAPWNLRQTERTLTAVRINWNDPSSNGSPIDAIVVFNQQTGRTCTAGPRVGTCVIDGLNPGTDYTFTAKAHNANGDSEWSSALAGNTGSSVPDVPSNLRQTDNSQTAVRLNWNDPAANGRGIDVITVMNQQTGRTCTAGPGTGTCVIDGLSPGRNYTFVVKAHNSNGDSAWSGAVGGNTQARPRIVSVGKGPSGGCGGCYLVSVSVSGFAPNATYGLAYWTNNGGVGVWRNSSIRTDGAGNYSGNPGGAFFGFPGKDVWVVVDGVKSNHARW